MIARLDLDGHQRTVRDDDGYRAPVYARLPAGIIVHREQDQRLDIAVYLGPGAVGGDENESTTAVPLPFATVTDDRLMPPPWSARRRPLLRASGTRCPRRMCADEFECAASLVDPSLVGVDDVYRRIRVLDDPVQIGPEFDRAIRWTVDLQAHRGTFAHRGGRRAQTRFGRQNIGHRPPRLFAIDRPSLSTREP